MDNKILSGYTFVFTGFSYYNKDYKKDLYDKIKHNGGRITSAVSRKTSFLITYDEIIETKKIIKAKEIGVKIINSFIFYKIINGEESAILNIFEKV